MGIKRKLLWYYKVYIGAILGDFRDTSPKYVK